jgi:hypothetical protein
MQTGTQPARESKKKHWIGWALTGLPILFLTFDSVIKLILIPAVVKSAEELGYPATTMRPIGAVLLLCVILYAIPRTSVLGAILLTGYLGGAVATHVRMLNPLFSHQLFPTYLGLFVWSGLYLRDSRVRALIPFRS